MKQISKFNETKLIVITRADIAPGYQVVQATHATCDFAHEFPDSFREWKTNSNSIICLSTPNELKLLQLFDKYFKMTPVVKFYEPDVDAYTSICLLGTPEVRKKLSHLSLSLKNIPHNVVD